MKEIWDKKAQSYPRYEPKRSDFQLRLFEKIGEFGVDFRDKTLIDIGCGTGVHTLFLAGICKNVTGVDLSSQMLKLLREDACKFNISNLQILESDFKSFESGEIYDIAFSTMSPAIADEEDFEKFINLGKKHVYLWWNKERHSDVLELFYDKFGRRVFKERLKDFEELLRRKNLKFHSQVLEEVNEKERSFDEMLENVLWHLQIGDIAASKNEVENELKKLQNGGLIKEKITSSMKLLVF